MDIYVLDELLRRTEVVDQYESFIWTERRSSSGDFELVVRSDRGMRLLLTVGKRLAILKSYRVMVIETVENTTDDDGNTKLKISGRSLETLLEDRANQSSTIAAGTTVEHTEITGTPADVARYFFDTFCRNNVDVPADNIPFIQPAIFFPPGSIPEPTESITFRYEYDSVYNSIQKICEVYDLGFRLIRNGDFSELYFEIYTGDDRTSLQSTNPAVIFSPGLDSLSNTTELTSNALLKNVAYVFGKNGSQMVYADGVDETIEGFDRRILVVKADDIDLAVGPDLTAALVQKGKEELAKHRMVLAFDGEIPQFGSYEYLVDYDLGDLVEQRSSDGAITSMRVTEQIFISDAEGERAYPTLSMDLLIPSGTWYSWYGNQMWDDADEYWYDV